MGNIELLRKTKEHMQSNPGLHNQGTWISFPVAAESHMCHTTMCTAGHAAMLAGAEIPTFEQYLNVGWVLNKDGKIDRDGEGVASWAEAQLGLNDDEYNYLFFCMDKEELFARIDQVLALWEEGKHFNYDTCNIIGEDDRD